MRVVRARYTAARRGGLTSAKGTVRYIVHRPDEAGQPAYRTGFDAVQNGIDKAAMYEQLETTQGAYYYRLILNPGEGQAPDGDFESWTRDVMAELQARQGQPVEWVAVVHDHAEHRHVHVIAVTERTLNKADLLALRTEAGASWERQAALTSELQQDPIALEHRQREVRAELHAQQLQEELP